MLNVRRFTQNGEQTVQDVSLAQDDRLDGLLEQPIRLQLTLNGKIEDNKPRVSGSVTGNLTSICQVCTEKVSWQHSFDFDLQPVEASKIDRVDDAVDPVIMEDGQLDLQDMLVNELLLSLPTVVTHADTLGKDCTNTISMTAGEQIAKKSSPFAVLEQLKSPNDGD